MNIDVEALGIPEPDYKAVITTPSSKFQNICTHLATIGDVGMSSQIHPFVKTLSNLFYNSANQRLQGGSEIFCQW
jgi:Proliferating cell nuclear antigen, C-terminal domain